VLVRAVAVVRRGRCRLAGVRRRFVVRGPAVAVVGVAAALAEGEWVAAGTGLAGDVPVALLVLGMCFRNETILRMPVTAKPMAA